MSISLRLRNRFQADPNPANGLRVFLADAGRNLRIYSYSRQDAESRSGTVLLPRAAFHLGAVANHFLRLSLPPRGAPPAAAAAGGRRRHALLYSTLDGAIGCLAQVGRDGPRWPEMARAGPRVPELARECPRWPEITSRSGAAVSEVSSRRDLGEISARSRRDVGRSRLYLAQVEEAAFRRLYFLSTKMVATMQHAAGLNPRGFRAQGSGATAEGELSQVIDGALLRRFVSLGSAAQERLARQIGIT